MKRLVVGFLILAAAAPSHGAQKDAVSYVNPLIGTQRSSIGYGGTMPFVTAPFGMTSWTAQTRQNKISVTSYNYDDTTVSGFIGTHQPAIWMGDYGYVTLVPEIGELKTTPDARKLPYDHKTEETHPDYYSVLLDGGEGGSIRVEMTGTERCAMLRFTFPNEQAAASWLKPPGRELRAPLRLTPTPMKSLDITQTAWMRILVHWHSRTSRVTSSCSSNTRLRR